MYAVLAADKVVGVARLKPEWRRDGDGAEPLVAKFFDVEEVWHEGELSGVAAVRPRNFGARGVGGGSLELHSGHQE